MHDLIKCSPPNAKVNASKSVKIKASDKNIKCTKKKGTAALVNIPKNYNVYLHTVLQNKCIICSYCYSVFLTRINIKCDLNFIFLVQLFFKNVRGHITATLFLKTIIFRRTLNYETEAKVDSKNTF